MKTTNIITAALAIALVFGACSKEQPALTESEKVWTTTQFEMSDDDYEAINQIVDFKEKLDRHKKGDLLKSDEFVTMEDAKWLIESVVNVFHGFPDAEIAYFTFEEAKIILPKDNLNDLMNMEEVALFDEDIRSKIIQQLASYGLDGRHLVQSNLSFTENADSLLIKTLIGVEGDERLPYKDYWYGDLMGACDGTFELETDAAKRIESLVHYHFISNRPTPPTNCRYVYVNPVSKEIIEPWLQEYQINFPPVNYLDFKVFFASDYFNEVPQGDLDDEIKCLDYTNEMLFYKQNYIALIEEFEIEKNKFYSGCVFVGKEYLYKPVPQPPIEYYSIMHELEFTVATRLMVCEIVDPTPID
jgi:hypothetical protein